MTDGLTLEVPVSARLTWDYGSRNEKLRFLYEKGKSAQWNATTDIDWSPRIEFGSPLEEVAGHRPVPFDPRAGCPVPEELWGAFQWEFHAWMTSQFLHGEQGALLATSRLVETSPDIDTKFYAAGQVTDEARHVEAYSRYLALLGHSYPVNGALRELLSDIISEKRWDVIFLGMQIIVEGLALAVFRFENTRSFDPIIRQITYLVAKDEARHVAFGVVALQEMIDGLGSRERAEREEFIKEASLLMARRFRFEDIWERMGIDVAAGVRYALNDPQMRDFRIMMFTKIISCLAKLGLLTEGVRDHLRQLALMRTPPGRTRR